MTLPTRWQVPSGYSASNDPDVFPALLGQKFIANKSPKFPKTIIKTAASGREVRVQMASQPTWDFKLTYEVLTNNPPASGDLQVLQSFFLSRNGQAQPFFFFDPFDNAVVNQQIGVGNGSTTAFQLVRAVGAGGANAFVEVIYAVLGPLTVTAGGVQMFGPLLNNLITYSQAFSNAAWGKNTITVADNAIVAPTGATTGSILTGTGSDSYVDQAMAQPIGTAVTGSVWLKVPSGTLTVDICINEGAITSVPCTLTTSWQRFSVTRTCTTTTPLFVIGGSGTLGSGAVIHAFGAQFEAAAAPSAYQPTSSALGDYSVGPYGALNFYTAPASGAIAWSGQFLFLCRFAQDNLDAKQLYQTLWSNDGLAFSSFHP